MIQTFTPNEFLQAEDQELDRSDREFLTENVQNSAERLEISESLDFLAEEMPALEEDPGDELTQKIMGRIQNENPGFFTS
jgi:hypothetical protein